MADIRSYPKAVLVYEIIAQRSQQAANRFREHFTATMFMGTSEEELVIINRFWRLQLSRVPVSTINELECLDDQADFNAWLHNFQYIVLPTIVAHRLPRHE